MQVKTLVLASLASLAVAQSSTSSAATSTSTSTCAAQNILDACLSQTKGQLDGCEGNDWTCLCSAYNVILTCYNNCPGDPSVFSTKQSRDQYCAAASAYGTSTSSTASAASTGAVTTSASTHAASATSSSSSSAHASSSTSASSNSAAGLKVGSGMLAVALAGLGLMA